MSVGSVEASNVDWCGGKIRVSFEPNENINCIPGMLQDCLSQFNTTYTVHMTLHKWFPCILDFEHIVNISTRNHKMGVDFDMNADLYKFDT